MNNSSPSRPAASKASVLLLLAFIYLTLAGTYDLPGASVNLKTAVLTLFCLVHGSCMLGVRRTLWFFVVSAVISWAFEQLGVMTGWIYGPYHYSDRLGARLADVPVLIPLAWFMMIYPAYVVANALAARRIYGTTGGWGRAVWLSLVGAVVMTGWDVVMDPIMSGEGYWVWEAPGEYFGVPFHNYVGWLITIFSVHLAYRAFEREDPKPQTEPQTEPKTEPEPGWSRSRAMALLPVLAFGISGFYYVAAAEPTELRLIACFVMGPPVLVALGRILDWGGEHGLLVR